jgi:hypothetical protein
MIICNSFVLKVCFVSAEAFFPIIDICHTLILSASAASDHTKVQRGNDQRKDEKCEEQKEKKEKKHGQTGKAYNIREQTGHK